MALLDKGSIKILSRNSRNKFKNKVINSLYITFEVDETTEAKD